MSSGDKVILEGGPGELAGHIVLVESDRADLKITFRNGHEHYRATPRRAETAEGVLPVYEWGERTEMSS